MPYALFIDTAGTAKNYFEKNMKFEYFCGNDYYS